MRAMNSARVTAERDGTIIFDHTEPMDEYEALRLGPGPAAQVEIGVGTSQEYGRLKISASVTLTCDQNGLTIDKAGYLGTKKSIELHTLVAEFLAQQPGEAEHT